jgi:hypothetical protein
MQTEPIGLREIEPKPYLGWRTIGWPLAHTNAVASVSSSRKKVHRIPRAAGNWFFQAAKAIANAPRSRPTTLAPSAMSTRPDANPTKRVAPCITAPLPVNSSSMPMATGSSLSIVEYRVAVASDLQAESAAQRETFTQPTACPIAAANINRVDCGRSADSCGMCGPQAIRPLPRQDRDHGKISSAAIAPPTP